MTKEIIIPDFGTSVDQVILLKWARTEGEHIAKGEVICEIETDKAATEMESFVDGVLLKRCVEEGDEVSVGTVIALIGDEDETLPEDDPSHEGLLAQQGHARAVSSVPETPTPQPSPSREASPSNRQASGARIASATVLASPKARQAARDRGLDIMAIPGSGPGGAVRFADVQSARSSAKEPAAGVFSANQQQVNRRLAASQREIIPVAFNARIHMQAAIHRRERARSEGGKLSFDAIFVHAVAEVIARNPRFAQHVEGDQAVASEGVHVGVAVSTEEELYIAVIQDADGRSPEDIDRDIRRLAEAARNGVIGRADMTGAVFTISNLGMFPVEQFNVIIPPGQSGALAIGCVDQVPVFSEDKTISAEPFCTVTLSADHRLINGRAAGRFLADLKQIIESL